MNIWVSLPELEEIVDLNPADREQELCALQADHQRQQVEIEDGTGGADVCFLGITSKNGGIMKQMVVSQISNRWGLNQQKKLDLIYTVHYSTKKKLTGIRSNGFNSLLFYWICNY
jgi:hypothetical protein